MNCPSCSSQNGVRIEVLHQRSRSMSTAVPMFPDPDFHTKCFLVDQFNGEWSSFAPPAASHWKTGLVCLMIILAIVLPFIKLALGTAAFVLGFLCFVAMLVVAIAGKPHTKKELQKYEEWRNTWYCNSCGAVYKRVLK